MIPMLVMKLVVVEIINMITVRHCLVSTVLVPSTSALNRRACIRILIAYRNDMLVIMIPMR
jgi:hypothetical protein